MLSMMKLYKSNEIQYIPLSVDSNQIVIVGLHYVTKLITEYLFFNFHLLIVNFYQKNIQKRHMKLSELILIENIHM